MLQKFKLCAVAKPTTFSFGNRSFATCHCCRFTKFRRKNNFRAFRLLFCSLVLLFFLHRNVIFCSCFIWLCRAVNTSEYFTVFNSIPILNITLLSGDGGRAWCERERCACQQEVAITIKIEMPTQTDERKKKNTMSHHGTPTV